MSQPVKSNDDETALLTIMMDITKTHRMSPNSKKLYDQHIKGNSLLETQISAYMRITRTVDMLSAPRHTSNTIPRNDPWTDE